MMHGCGAWLGAATAEDLSYTKADGSKLDIVTLMGERPRPTRSSASPRRPEGLAEISLAETPTAAIFVNIQHPGEATKMSDVADPTKYQSQWPRQRRLRRRQAPRSATIVITKKRRRHDRYLILAGVGCRSSTSIWPAGQQVGCNFGAALCRAAVCAFASPESLSKGLFSP